MSVVNNNLLLAAEDADLGYVIDRSLRFRASASAYLNRTPASAGNRRTWTWSGWVKRGVLSNRQAMFGAGVDGNNENYIGFNTDNTFYWYSFENSTQYRYVSSGVYRDVSAWYHCVVTLNTTLADANERVKLYINGSRVAIGTQESVPQNYDARINNNVGHGVGASGGATPFPFYLDGYLTEINFVDGQALDPDSFGEYNEDTGVWQPKKYEGTYGTNGFYLNFGDPTTLTTLTADQSGNGNNWTTNNISLTSGATFDSMIDTPTPVTDERGNFCVLNPISGNATSVSNGNLTFVGDTGFTYYLGAIGTFSVSSGKWYWEAFAVDGDWLTIGIIPENSGPITPTINIQYLLNARTYMKNGSKTVGNGSGGQSSSSYGATFDTGDTIGVALDMDVGEITFYKNNVSQGVAFTGITGGQMPLGAGFNSGSASFTFGQRPFEYTPPSGFKALHTGNLPEPAIVDGGEYFNTVLYTGNGTAGRAIDTGLATDLFWVKQRSGTNVHYLTDIVRGPLKGLSSNLTDAESTFDSVRSFTSTGVTVGTSATTNSSGQSYVAWNWKANGAGVSNTAGSITSTVSAGVTQGFSVVTFTAPASGTFSVGHGLGVQPALVIFKSRSNGVGPWYTWHKSLASSTQSYLRLNNTNAAVSVAGTWGAGITSTVIGAEVGNTVVANATQLIYCFAEVPGYSRFGSYTGNGSADGPFVFTGFRPAFVMVKRTNGADDWVILDTKRDPSNLARRSLFPNSASSETANGFYDSDILSNGLKVRSSNVVVNASGGTYIFMAFAETDFANALAR